MKEHTQTKVEHSDPLAGVAKEQGKAPVIPLPQKPGTVPQPKPAAQKRISRLTLVKTKAIWRRLVPLSFILCVIIPSFFGAYYFLFLASDRYAASAGFSVRSLDNAAVGGDLVSAITGTSSSGSTTTDSYIIMEYLVGRELVEKLIKDASFLKAYSGDDIDFWYRLDTTLPIEEIVDYWSWMIAPSYDNTSGLIEFEVQAFTQQDALNVANLIVEHSQDLINRLSEQARRDAVKFAEGEVATAELRLRLIRQELKEYRESTKALDPEASASAQIALTTGIEQRLIELRSRLSSARGAGLSETSPTVRSLLNEISSVEKQLALKKAEIDTDNVDGSLSEILANFERLRVDQEFAQQAYTLAQASLEQSRIEATRQQRFLAVYRHPNEPQDAIYPERELNALMVFVICTIIWSLGLLLVQSVRDHIR